jgi:hypothetical protein
VAAGQLDRWTLNQRLKVRMLASWDHIRVLKPALSCTNGHSRRNPATRQLTNPLANPGCSASGLRVWALLGRLPAPSIGQGSPDQRTAGVQHSDDGTEECRTLADWSSSTAC